MVSLQIDRWLEERRPAPDLTAVLRCAWQGNLLDFRTPLPDECLDLTWIDDGTLWLSGPESRSWTPGEPTVGVEHPWGDRAARELVERLALLPDHPSAGQHAAARDLWWDGVERHCRLALLAPTCRRQEPALVRR